LGAKVPLNWEDRACLGPIHASSKGTFQVKTTGRRAKITASADGSGIVSQAGGLLLVQAAQLAGLGQGLSAGLARWRPSRAVHDPGKIVTDLVLAVALGGDCLADVAVLRAQPELSGPVASDPVVSRLIAALAADAPRALKAIRVARAAARERAWALAGATAPGAGGELIVLDVDATIVTSCSEKEQAAPTWKKTFGFHPVRREALLIRAEVRDRRRCACRSRAA
jgi:Transposase DDE domain group 1